MNILKTLAAATAVAAMSSTSFAGGLSDQIMEAPVVVEEEVGAAGPSIDPAIIVLGILALLLIGASSGGDDSSTPVEEGCEPFCDEFVPLAIASQ
jgi:hypothetical protein